MRKTDKKRCANPMSSQTIISCIHFVCSNFYLGYLYISFENGKRILLHDFLGFFRIGSDQNAFVNSDWIGSDRQFLIGSNLKLSPVRSVSVQFTPCAPLMKRNFVAGPKLQGGQHFPKSYELQ